MTKLEKILLGIVGTCVLSVIGGGVAVAVNNAVRANGIEFLRLATDVCPSGSKTCVRSDLAGSLIQKKDGMTSHIVAVSPSPNPSTDNNKCVTYDSTSGIYDLTACGGGSVDGLKAVYEAASATTQNIIHATAADGTVVIEDDGAGVFPTAFQVRDGDGGGVFDIIKTTNDDGSDTVRLGYGPWAFGTSIPTGTIRTENTTAATGGAPIQGSPSAFIGGRCWDGAASRTCGGLLVSKSETSGASYTGELDFYVRRNATDTRIGGFSYNGAVGVFDALNIAATAAMTVGTTLDVPDIGNSGSAITLSDNMTTNGFVGPNYGGTSTNVPTVTWHEIGAGGEPTFSNSWVNDGTATYPTAAFHKDSGGRVTMKGYIKSGTSFSAVAFTLPAGYRPTQRHFFACYAAAACLGQVNTNGEVSYLAGATTGSTLSTTFFAEQ